MKHILVIGLCLSHAFTMAQTTTLQGSWVRVLQTEYEDAIRQAPPIIHKDYLKLAFGEGGQMKVYSHYTANGVSIPFKFSNNLLTYGFNQEFKIEQQQEDLLVMVALVDGNVNEASTRHYYVPERMFLDRLPTPKEDRVIIGKDTGYLASKKLYPIFQTTNTPDFHIFIHNQVRSAYLAGENYLHATFMIRPDGTVDHININHHVSKASDKRVLKAILASAGRWQMPLLNGKEVNVVMSIEDLFTKRSESTSSPLTLDFSTNPKDPVVYMNNFKLAVRSMLTQQHEKALEHLQLCDEQKPKDPNLTYLRYLLFNDSGRSGLANEQLALVKKSKLKYLLK